MVYVRPAGVTVTVEPSVVETLLAVSAVLDCTALAFVPLLVVLPPTVGLNIKTDLTYASEVVVTPKLAEIEPV